MNLKKTFLAEGRHNPNPSSSIFKNSGRISLILALFISLMTSQSVMAQSEKLVTVNAQDETLLSVFTTIENQTGYKFAYSLESVNVNQKVTVQIKNKNLNTALTLLFKGKGINFTLKEKNILLSKSTEAKDPNTKPEVSGTVYDSDGEPLIAATVTVIGSNVGTVTDVNGNYSITADPTATLRFSFVGTQTQNLKVGNNTQIDVRLMSSINIDEVVVIGYGTSSRKGLSTAVGSVKSDALLARPTNISVLQGLAGQIAGVNVMSNSGKPGANAAIKIRGTSSINSSNDPLYVIDGMVGADPLTIDPNIVESIDVLKDAASCAIYGARGANGVIIMTTKKGKAGASEVQYQALTSFATLANKLDLANSTELAEVFKRAYEFVPGRVAPHLDATMTTLDFPRKAELFNADGTPIYNTDWQDECTRLAISKHHSLSFTGGTKDFSALANISYKDDQGIMLNSNRKQLNAFINLDWNVKKWLNIQTSINAGSNESHGVDGGGITLTETRVMLEALPFLPVKYADGTYSRKGDYPDTEEAENPVKMLKERMLTNGRQYALGNIIGTIKFSDNLKLVSSWGAQTNAQYNFNWSGNNIYDFSETQKGVATRKHWNYANWSNEDYLSFTKKMGEHSLDLVGGASWYYSVNTSTTAGSEGYFDNFYKYYNLGVGTVTQTPGSGFLESSMNSYFARGNYNYGERYYVGASFRVDGSSKVGKNNKYGNFPSFSAAWRPSNEEFFSGLSGVINNLKFRGSYGAVGNSEIGDYQTLDKMASQQTVFNKTLVTGVILESLKNDNLKWERSTQADIGMDLGLFNSRIDVTFDLYNKVTTDLLYFKKLPSSSGYTGAMDNIGSIRNQGLEFSLRTLNVKTTNFSWRTSFNYSMNRSKVLNINGDTKYTWAGIIQEGSPLNSFYGYVRLGTWGTEEAAAAAVYGKIPGDLKFEDRNDNDQKDSGDRTIIGNGMPKFEANMTNYFMFKGFTFSFELQCMYGHSIMNFTRSIMENRVTYSNCYNTSLDAWTPENQNTMITALKLPLDGYENDADSRVVEGASFLRVRNISLSYSFKKEWLKQFKINELNLGVNAENMLLFTKYSGYDPEVTTFDASFNQGVDMYQYPKPKTISVSLGLKF